MSYNKAKEEKKWVQWKQAEEKQLRALGVSEDMIQRLHTYDWQIFKKERNYQRWNIKDEEYLQGLIDLNEPSIETVEQLLDQIENQQLYSIVSNLDQFTLELLLYRIKGFSDKEIGNLTGIRSGTITNKFYRLRKKFKNF